ncbi:MAG: hypothetical protein C0501_23120 [Isosphaera sp.]|nr:hypothetical protein [Isosphaera sp.]
MTPTAPPVIAPPFSLETDLRKVRLAEDAWNSRDPHRVSLAYTEDSVWRNRSEFVTGRDAIRAFLAGKWEREHDYQLAHPGLVGDPHPLSRVHLPGVMRGGRPWHPAGR